jgi:hypothetical protein
MLVLLVYVDRSFELLPVLVAIRTSDPLNGKKRVCGPGDHRS